ncbi:MAG TPA: hypothetical protein ENN29_04340 [Candidatus Hydrogenedentes bacterium]|nr:hypothetical protein [Candidatus Hydrogenedentota bacterium]
MRIIYGTMLLGVTLAVTLTSGCDSDSLYVSVEELNFGETKSRLTFDIYNANPERKEISVELEASEEWFTIEPTEATSAAPAEVVEPDYDETTIEVVLDRKALAGDPVKGQIEIKGRRLKKKRIPVFAAPPYEAISLSTETLNIGGEENYLEVLVKNVNKIIDRLDVYATPDSAWIDINRTAISLGKRNSASTIIIGAKRSRLTGGYHEGQIIFEAAGFAPKVMRVSVFQPYQAIVTSNQMLDFERNERPMLMEVWNGNAEFQQLNITASVSDNWIEVLPRTFSSAAPVTSIDPVLEQPVVSYDKRQVLVSIRRRRLDEGSHEGYILFQSDSPLIAPRPVVVKVIKDEDGPDTSGELRIEDPKVLYSLPYLVDFAFGLTNADGDGFVAEPAQLTVGAFENKENVSALVQPVLHRGAARQLRAEIVLDYSIGMRLHPDAMDEMEYAATELFLAGLPEEALVGATLYYRDDLSPERVCPFTFDHHYVAEQINAIRDTMIGSFSSGSRLLDALRQAAVRFDRENINDEERFILLLAGSGDTSSTETVDRVVNAARQRHVRIHVLGFLSDLEGATLMLDIAARTGGVYLPVGAAEELPQVVSLIVDRLEANYLLRWATLKRQDVSVIPGFSVAFTSYPAAHTSDTPFNPSELAGDVLEGRLRLASSRTGDTATVLLRAEYIPRNIVRMRAVVASPLAFTVCPVPAANSGLIEHWNITRSDEDDGTVVLDMTSADGSPLPFATFGGLIRFDFDGTPSTGTPIFASFAIDNGIEEYAAGQHFIVVE